MQEAEVLAARREALRLAEQLFDMDVTAYPVLAEVRRGLMSGLLLPSCLLSFPAESSALLAAHLVLGL